MQPPIATSIDHQLIKHTHTRTDQYYWFRDKTNPRVIAHIEAENAYTKQMMKPTEALQQKLFKEIKSRIKQTDVSAPYKLDNYYYYTRYEQGKDYPIHCRKLDQPSAVEEIILEVNELAAGHTYFRVTAFSVSENENILAYTIDLTGARKNILYFKNLKTGEHLTDVLPEICQFTWANDNKTIFYSIYDDAMRSYKILRHKLGTDIAEDVEVFHEKEEVFSCYVAKCSSKKYLYISTASSTSSEYHFLPIDEPDGKFQVFLEREKNHEYSIEHYGGKFYIVTNKDAINFKMLTTPVEKIGRENWEIFIPHRDNVLLEDAQAFEDFIAIEERVDGLCKLRVLGYDGKMDYYIDTYDETCLIDIDTNFDLEQPILRYSYQSLTTPASVYDINVFTKEKTLVKQQEVLAAFDPKKYESKRIFAIAEDGTQIPISLVYKKGIVLDGNNKTCLYGYGAYGVSMEPYFSPYRLSLLNRGFIWAIAHIRGGEDMGRKWYEDGKFLKKKNTFTDFIACAKHLIQGKYTNSENLVIQGGSAGGLLIGAVVNMAPQLFKGAIASVPFVDVLTTMLDASIPLTTGEYEEWGNPEDKSYYDYILSYSPYDNVKRQDYPTMLVETGINDSQVHYWEPLKWVAKLRTHKTDNNPLLLKVNMEAGHMGGSGRETVYKEIAFEYAFILQLFQIQE